ncbi:MAG: hypothetical protein ACI4PE_03535 [Bacilli bacterium]
MEIITDIYNLEHGYEVVLLENNKQYIFDFYNYPKKDYYTIEEVVNLISTIIIE